MKTKDVILAALILLGLLALSSASAQAAVFGWSDYQRHWFEFEAGREYWTYESGTLYNGTTITNETATMGYENITELGHDDVSDVVVFEVSAGTVIASGNYTLDYQYGNVTMDEYNPDDVVNETLVLCTNASAGDNVTNNANGLVSGTLVLFNTTSGAAVPTGDYTITASTGNVVCTNDSSPYQGINVSANYTFYNASWAVGINYTWANKLSINCTPLELDSGTIDVFVKKIQFLNLGARRRVSLWNGAYVVNSDDGTLIDDTNIMGKGWYVNNATNYDALDFNNYRDGWDRTNTYSLRVDDVTINSTGILVNVLCKYRVR